MHVILVFPQWLGASGVPWPFGVVGLIGGLLLVVGAYALGRKRASAETNGLAAAGKWAVDRAGLQATVGVDSESDLVSALESWVERLATVAPPASGGPGAKIEADLDMARDFQNAYLNRPYPKVPETHIPGRLRLSFYHRYQAAMALGGDFFDIVPLAPDAVGVFVADVMGHGARSALITAMMRTLLRDLRGQGRNARHYMSEINHELCEIMRAFPQPLFASAFYFVPDTTSRMATFSTAGHPAPFYLHRARAQLTRLNVPPPHGAALGILPEEKYTGGSVRLHDEDLFLFFTDGVYEAMNADGEEFGLDRVRAIIKQYQYKSNQVIVDAIMEGIQTFIGDAPLNDDICIVAVDVVTEPEPTTTN